MESQNDRLAAFGREVTRLREERKMSIAELAGRCDIAPAELVKIEAGEFDVPIPLIFGLARQLGVRAKQLLDFI